MLSPPERMTHLSTLCFSLALSLVEKEGRLLVLQEADSVRQQELNSLRQDIQEAQEGQRELGLQVPTMPEPDFLVRMLLDGL